MLYLCPAPRLAMLSGLLVALIWTTNASAVLTAYEGFDYEPGTVIGQNGGFGWTTAWTRNRVDAVAGGLTYMDANGNELVVTGNHGFGSGELGNADAQRDMALQNSGTTWISFIGQRLQPHDTEEANLRRASSFQLREGGTEKVSVGKVTESAPATPTTVWGLFESGNNANLQTTTTPIFDQAFHVMRIDHLGDNTVADDVWLWVDPLLDSEPQTASADAALIGVRDYTYNAVRLFVGNVNGDNPYAHMNFDEIRVGTTFADVAPIVPEPATCLLALASIAGLACLRRLRAA